MVKGGLEVIDKDLVLVFFISFHTKHVDEVIPASGQPSLDVLDQHKSLRLDHLVVNLAVVGELRCHEPTVVIFARLNPSRAWHVPTPVCALVRLHNFAYSCLKVFVADFAITIMIKVVEHLIEFFLGHRNTPVCQVEFEVIFIYSTIVADIHLHECTTHLFPLVVHLGLDLFNQVSIVGLTHLSLVFLREFQLKTFHVL